MHEYPGTNSNFNSMYKVKTGTISFDVAFDDERPVVDGQPFSWDKVEVGPNHFHIIHEGKSYQAVVMEVDKVNKKMIIKVNNNIYHLSLQDKFDVLLEKMGMNNAHSGRVNSIKAPMPGLIVDLRVKEGDEVKSNDPLIVLEAMKMENIIKSPGDGIVKSIRVKKGESVEKNQILIEF